MAGIRLWSRIGLALLLCFLAGHGAAEPSTASIQSLLGQLPSCAVVCVGTAVSQSSCALTDISCICSSDNIVEASRTCILEECTVRDALETQRIQASACGLPTRNQSGIVKRVQWSGFCLSFLAVAFRFAARLPIMNGVGIGWDDWTILACLITAIGSDVLLSFMLNNGLGQDVWTLSPERIDNVLKLYWISAFLYVSIMNGIKVSIVLLYLRMFPAGVTKWFTRACYILIGLLVATALALCLSNALACSPVAYYWLRWDGEHRGHCINTTAQIFAGAGINIFSDLVVFFLPVPLIIGLTISTYKKIGVCLTFTVGLFATVCSIIRLQYLVHWGQSTNPTFDYTSVATWSLVESNLGMVCACMPPMARPIKRAWNKIMSLTEYISFGSEGTITSGLPTIREDRPVRSERKAFSDYGQYRQRPESPDEIELFEQPVSPASSSEHRTHYTQTSKG